jgi:hypothetical protein
MKKITLALGMLGCLLVHGQRLNWTNLTPYGIAQNAAQNAWHSGRAMDVVDYQDGSVLVGSEMGGVWWANQNGESACLTDNLDDPDINAIERGPDGEHHIYFATNANLYESRGPRLASPVRIPLPMGAKFVKDIAILNGARRIIIGCDNGVFWSGIPNPLQVVRSYTWRQAIAAAAGGSVFSLSAKSTGSAWQAAEQPTSEAITNRRMAVVSRSPIYRDIFWIAPDGTVKSSWNVLGESWAGHTFAVTRAGTASPNSEIVAVARSSGQIDLFYLGNSGELKTAWWNEGANRWNDATILPTVTLRASSALAAVSRSASSLDLFGVGPTGRLVHTQWTESLGWRLMASPAAAEATSANTPITAVARAANKLDLFWLDSEQRLKTASWSENPAPTWGASVLILNFDRVAESGGIAAVARNPSHLDLLWVSVTGQLMTSYWDESLPEGWRGHEYSLTARDVVATDARVTLLARHPLQLDAFWKGRDGAVHTNWWYAYSPNSFAAQTGPLGSLDAIGGQLYASSAMDDEITLYSVTNAGNARCQRWTTDNGNVLVGYLKGLPQAVQKGTFSAGELQISPFTLSGGDGVYSTASVSLSKYGTAGYVAIANPNRPNLLNSIYKSTDFGNVWTQTRYVINGSTNALQVDLGGQGDGRNNTIAVSPIDNDFVYIGFVGLFVSRQGGNTWDFVGSDHVHADIARVVFGSYDKSWKTSYFCTDGGLSATTTQNASFQSGYDRRLSTLQCYSTDPIRQSAGTMSLSPTTDGLIVVGLQDNGDKWTVAGGDQWSQLCGGDGGFTCFTPTGECIYRGGLDGGHNFGRATWRAGRLEAAGVVPVVRPFGTETDLQDAGIVTLASPITWGPSARRIEGLAWKLKYLYTLESPTASTPWRFGGEVALTLASPADWIAAVDYDRSGSAIVGTNRGQILKYDPMTGIASPMAIDLNGVGDITRYIVTRIHMVSASLGYAVLTPGFEGNGGQLLKFNGTTWGKLLISVPGIGEIPDERIFGLDIDHTVAEKTILLSTDDMIYMSRNGGMSWTQERTGLPTRAHLADVRFVSWPTRGRKFLVSTFGRGVWITNAP